MMVARSGYVVLMAVSKELAQTLSPDATVEAEYGDTVVLGREETLAHHAPGWTDRPAPCVADVRPLSGGSGTILVSHVDLDTIGGVLALLGEKPEAPAFWKAAAFIDVRGPHRVLELGEQERADLRAWWAWSAAQPRRPRPTTVVDVTADVLRSGEVLFEIIAGDEELRAAGHRWALDAEVATEGCLVEEDALVRVFVTQRVFCSASYWSPKQRLVVPATVVLNTTTGAITVACEGGQFNARDLARGLWGPDAGGHAGIAGSPRGRAMTQQDVTAAVAAVRGHMGTPRTV